jgi:hypothetical protein
MYEAISISSWAGRTIVLPARGRLTSRHGAFSTGPSSISTGQVHCHCRPMGNPGPMSRGSWDQKLDGSQRDCNLQVPGSESREPSAWKLKLGPTGRYTAQTAAAAHPGPRLCSLPRRFEKQKHTSSFLIFQIANFQVASARL